MKEREMMTIKSEEKVEKGTKNIQTINKSKEIIFSPRNIVSIQAVQNKVKQMELHNEFKEEERDNTIDTRWSKQSRLIIVLKKMVIQTKSYMI